MKFYFAPMEGLTGYIYRNAHHCFFGQQITKYFAPFIVANQSESFKTKEINDLLPEHNEGLRLIPQLLTNNAGDFIQTSKRIHALGYDEINLNLGCPSGTVVAKYRGSGFLAKREQLDYFLEEIFSHNMTKISVKTRIGKDDPEEFYELIEIFNKYPMEELIIHPRIQQDYYKNKPNLGIFRDAISLSKNPVVYNGDICTVRDYEDFCVEFPQVDTMMLGRGLIANPGLIDEITNGRKIDKVILRAFHDSIYEGYKQVLYGDRNVLFRMKEIWFYMLPLFTDNAKYGKQIKKAERCHDYEVAVEGLFRDQELVTKHEGSL